MTRALLRLQLRDHRVGLARAGDDRIELELLRHVERAQDLARQLGLERDRHLCAPAPAASRRATDRSPGRGDAGLRLLVALLLELLMLRVEEALPHERDRARAATPGSRRRAPPPPPSATCSATGDRTIWSRVAGRRPRRSAARRPAASTLTSALCPLKSPAGGVASTLVMPALASRASSGASGRTPSRPRAPAAGSSLRLKRSASSRCGRPPARPVRRASSPARVAHVDQPGYTSSRCRRSPRASAGGCDVRADRVDQPVAHHDRPARDHRPGGGDHPRAADRIDVRRIRARRDREGNDAVRTTAAKRMGPLISMLLTRNEASGTAPPDAVAVIRRIDRRSPLLPHGAPAGCLRSRPPATAYGRAMYFRYSACCLLSSPTSLPVDEHVRHDGPDLERIALGR